MPIRGTDVGTWDVPVNNNFTSIDAIFGSVTTVALTSAPVTLATSQALVNVIRLTGTLNANVAITLPGIYKSWTVDNQLLNSPSSFAATFVSTSGASIIGSPPGPQDIFYDGTNVKYKALDKIGEYWDYCGGVVPTWVTASSIPPYLNCTGTTFSSATYPILANLIGGNTLPDLRGTARYSLNQGTGRLTTALGGLDGNTLFSLKTTQVTLGTSNLPPYTPAGNVSVTSTGANFVTNTGGFASQLAQGGLELVFDGFGAVSKGTVTSTGTLTGTAQGGVSNVLPVPSATVFGITMIRAA